MARYGLSKDFDHGGSFGRDDPGDFLIDAEVEDIDLGELPEGVERDEKGQLRRRTSWGWDYSEAALGP